MSIELQNTLIFFSGVLLGCILFGLVAAYLIYKIEKRHDRAVNLLKKERNRRAHLEAALEATAEAHEQTYTERYNEGFKAGELTQKAKVPVFPKQYLTDELMHMHLMKREAV